MKRYWIRWYAEHFENWVNTPFYYWISGETMHEPPQYICVALVETDDESKIKPAVESFFDVVEWSFIEEVSLDYDPNAGGRFPNSDGTVSLEWNKEQ